MHAIRGRLDDVRRERAEAQAESDAWLARVDQLDTEESHLNALLALQAEHPSQEIRVDLDASRYRLVSGGAGNPAETHAPESESAVWMRMEAHPTLAKWRAAGGAALSRSEIAEFLRVPEVLTTPPMSRLFKPRWRSLYGLSDLPGKVVLDR